MLARKRKRTVPLTVQDVLHLGRLMVMENDSYKEKSPRELNLKFSGVIGC